MRSLLSKFLTSLSRVQMIFVCFLLLATVAGLDHLTGYELSFSIFYLLPIFLVAWFLTRLISFYFCGLAALSWLFVDYFSPHAYSNALIPLWNTGVRFSFFILTTFLLVELKARLHLEQDLARTDGLTGIFNARAFRELSSSFLELAERHNHSVALGYVDIDDFKKVNDNLGHSEGDEVLKAVAKILQQCVRTSDVLGRLGGDEFAIFLPETDENGAKKLFSRIHKELTNSAAARGWPIGFSIGVAVFNTVPGNIDAALKIADNLMYRVKKSGKNNLSIEIKS